MNFTFEQIAAFLSLIFSSSVLTVLVTHYLSKSTTITGTDKEKFEFYKFIYFNGVRDGLGNPLPINQASVFFTGLCKELSTNKEESLLLNTYVLKLLRKFIEYPDDSNSVIKLQNRIRKDFKVLRKKMGYSFSTVKEFIFYVIAFLIAGISFFITINLLKLFPNYLNNNTLFDFFILCFFTVYFLAAFILSSVYLFFNSYVYLDYTNK